MSSIKEILEDFGSEVADQFGGDIDEHPIARSYIDKALADIEKLIEDEVIGTDTVRKWDDSEGYCMTCMFQPTDESKNCICRFRNIQKDRSRKALNKLTEGYKE